MARFRLARPAQVDLARILATSADRWGAEGRQRYADLLAAAMRQVAADPGGPLTRKRPELRSAGIHSFHVRYARRSADSATVGRPVHVPYYRVAEEGVIEIVRVLHERMDPGRHLREPTAARGDLKKAFQVLERAGKGHPPLPGDELPERTHRRRR